MGYCYYQNFLKYTNYRKVTLSFNPLPNGRISPFEHSISTTITLSTSLQTPNPPKLRSFSLLYFSHLHLHPSFTFIFIFIKSQNQSIITEAIFQNPLSSNYSTMFTTVKQDWTHEHQTFVLQISKHSKLP